MYLGYAVTSRSCAIVGMRPRTEVHLVCASAIALLVWKRVIVISRALQTVSLVHLSVSRMVHRSCVAAGAIHGTSGVVPGRSPGGSDENTGNASAFNERLRIGIVDVILIPPVKFDNPRRGPTFAAPCASGPRVTIWLPNFAPAALYAAIVIVADCVVEGFA